MLWWGSGAATLFTPDSQEQESARMAVPLIFLSDDGKPWGRVEAVGSMLCFN